MGKASGLLLNSLKDPLWGSEVSETGCRSQLVEEGMQGTDTIAPCPPLVWLSTCPTLELQPDDSELVCG